MCLDPGTMGVAGMALQGIGAIGKYNASRAQAEFMKKQYYAKAESMKLEANRLRIQRDVNIAQADDVSSRSFQDQINVMRQTTQALGSVRAAAAASGTDGTGSASWAENVTAIEGEEAKSVIQQNYLKQRWAFLNRAQDADWQAGMTDWAAKNEIAAGDFTKASGDTAAMINLLSDFGNLAVDFTQFSSGKSKKSKKTSSGYGKSADS